MHFYQFPDDADATGLETPLWDLLDQEILMMTICFLQAVLNTWGQHLESFWTPPSMP